MAKKAYLGLSKEFTVTNLLDYNTLSTNDGGYWGKWNVSGQTDYVNWATSPQPPGGQLCGAFGRNITSSTTEATYQLCTSNAVKAHLEPSHKYYFSIHLYQPSVVGTFAAYWPSQEPPLMSNAKLTSAKTWQQFSTIVSRTGFAAGDYDVRFDFDNPTVGAWLNFGNVILVDLTATFGAGGEPDKSWCDSNLAFRDSSSTDGAVTSKREVTRGVARKVKKFYIGGQHSFRNLFFLENAENVIYQYTWSNSTGKNVSTSSAGWIKDSPYSMVMLNESASPPGEILRFVGGANRPLNNAHKYYFRCWLFQPEKNGSFDFYWKEQEPAVVTGATVTGNNQWTLVSTVFNRNGFTNGNYQVRFDYNSPGVNKNLMINGVMLVDLTETFGAGNEPDKAWCDAHIPYVGTASGSIRNVAELVSKNYVGVNGKARASYTM